MKRKMVVKIATMLTLVLGASSAYAFPSFDNLYFYKFKFSNWETWTDADKSTKLSEGDTISGFLRVTEIYKSDNPNDNNFTNSAIWTSAAANEEFTGKFDFLITGVSNVTGSAPHEKADVAMNGTMSLYVDANKNSNVGAGTGFTDGNPWADLVTAFWNANGLIGPDFTPVDASGTTASASGGLTFLPGGNHTGVSWDNSQGFEFFVQNTIKPATGSLKDIYTFTSDDPVTGQVVPEPSTIALVGLGLAGLGIGAFRRKK